VLLWRALRRRCPYCGTPGIFRNWLSLRDACPGCGTSFHREDGYFLGAYAINLIVAEFIGLGIVIFLLARTDLELLPLEIIAVALAVGLPLFFFPFARTLWMALDLFIHRDTTERYVRTSDIPGGQ
jgi:uncharacterized protein (DUF983 family)